MRPLPSRLRVFVTIAAAASMGVAAGGAEGQERSRTHLAVGFEWLGVTEGDEGAGALELTAAREGPFRPLRMRAGATVAWHGAAYAYGGIDTVLRLHPTVELVPSLGVGAYRKGGGPDLGSALAFRSSLELGYRAASGDRVSVFLYHLSNAGIGRRNPGVEAVGISFSSAR